MTSKTQKSQLLSLMNVGQATLKDLQILGIERIEQLKDKTPDQLYESLQKITGTKHDPVYGVFLLQLFMKYKLVKNYLDFIGVKLEKTERICDYQKTNC